jgi:prepilin-type N-terminal cleavage/methylation domain-containing protein
VKARLAALRSDERGYTLMELVTSMAILGAIMGSLTVLLVSATKAEVDMNKRFQAQTEARLGLDKLRREVHCAMSITPTGASSSVTLTIPSTCPTAAGLTTLTWCTVANGANRWGLWRYTGASCSGTGRKWADYLTSASVFTYTAQSTTSLAKLSVVLPVNLTPARPERVYKLDDDIVLRNSTRA